MTKFFSPSYSNKCQGRKYKQMAQPMNKFIIAVVVIGVTLIMGIFIAATIQDATREGSTAGSISNETLTTVSNITAETVANAGLNDFSMTIGIVTNATDGVVIAAGNYTSTLSGTVIATDAGAISTFNNTNWNVSYTYIYSGDTNTSDAAGDLVTALSGGSAWITILIVVGFATIVLGMLTQGLSRKEQEMESGYVY